MISLPVNNGLYFLFLLVATILMPPACMAGSSFTRLGLDYTDILISESVYNSHSVCWQVASVEIIEECSLVSVLMASY